MTQPMKFQAEWNGKAVEDGIDRILARVKGLTDTMASQGQQQANTAKQAGERIVAEVDKTERQRIALQRASISQEEALRAKTQADTERWWQRQLAIQDQAEAKKAALQRASIALEDQMEKRRAAEMEQNSRKSLQVTQSQAAATARIERQAAIAESALVLDKFDRRIAVETVKHTQILANLKGNDAAQEAEIRRHTALVARLQMDKANLPNTPFQQLLGGMTQSMGIADGAMGMAGMAAGALGAAFAISKLGEAIHGTVEAAMDMQTIHQTLDFASGSAKQGAEDFRFLQIQAQTLGISMRDSAPEFTRMEAAAKGTASEGKVVKDVFRSMSEAAVTLHMNTDMASRGFYALQEMMSMGSVQTRQLRMLSLSLPGAFQDAAKAMGVTTEEMMKMMAHGKVMTDDFLPKFAAVMRDKYEKPSVEASENARQSIQKFKNMIFETSAAVGETFLNAMGMGAKAILKIADAYDATSIAAQHARKDAFNAKFMAGGFQDYGDAVVKATGATAAFQRQLEDNYNKAHPKKEIHSDTAEQIANQIKLQEELEVARAEAMRDGEAKQIAIENNRYEKEKEKLLGSKKEIELLEQIHKDKVIGIHAEAAQKQADVEAEVHNKVLASQREFQAKIRAAAKKDQDDAVKRDEDRTNKIYAAQDALAQLQLKNDPVALLKKQEDAELAQTNLAESAKLAIKRRYEILTEDLQKQAASRSGQVVSQGLNVVMGLYHKHGAEYKAWAQAKNAVDTSMAAMAAYESAASIPYVGWLMGPVAAGVAVAAGLENASKINSAQFYTGGYTGDGDPRDPAGIVHKDEYVVDHSTMARVGGPTGVKRALNSPSSSTSQSWAPVINVHMAPGTTAADAHAIADTIDSRLRNLAKDLKEIDYRGITA